MKKVLGAQVELATLSGTNDEIEIFLSTGLKLLSVCHDNDGPDWRVNFNE